MRTARFENCVNASLRFFFFLFFLYSFSFRFVVLHLPRFIMDAPTDAVLFYTSFDEKTMYLFLVFVYSTKYAFPDKTILVTHSVENQ